MTSLSTVLWRAFAFLVVVFMLSPLILVILFSFGKSELAHFPIRGLWLGWYGEIFTKSAFWQAFGNSLKVSGSVGVASTVVGTMAAMALARMRERLAGPVIVSICSPVMLPPLVIGIALLSFYVRVGIELSLLTVILSHLVITQPFVVLIVYARMVGFDYAAVDSARDLGASPWRAFRTITLPIVRPTVIGAALIAMAISLDDFLITFFTIGGGNTLPTFVWGKIRTSLDPSINAIATILITLTISASVLALRISRYRG